MKYKKLSHVVANQDYQKCVDDVETFCKNKLAVEKVYSTTVLMIGAGTQGQMYQAQTIIITSCLIMWEAPEAEANRYLLEQRAKNGQIKM